MGDITLHKHIGDVNQTLKVKIFNRNIRIFFDETTKHTQSGNVDTNEKSYDLIHVKLCNTQALFVGYVTVV